MAKQRQSEILDRIVEAILAGRVDLGLGGDSGANPEMAALARLAARLRNLPREDFREHLKTDLERRAAMTTAGTSPGAGGSVNPVRKGFHTITPYLVVSGAAKLIDFAKQAFGAEEVLRVQRPGTNLIMHAEFRIGDSMIELADANDQFPPTPAALHVFFEDVDAVYRLALEAGAVSIAPPADQEYGERGASIKDASGNYWYLARNLGANYIPEGLRTVNIYLQPQGTARLIEFLKNAFAAEEILVAKSPDGIIVHAKMKIGDSIIEMGEAHGPYPSLPTTVHIYTPDCDALYERTLRAGAISLMPPKDEPYGDRIGGVTDPFGNRWFVATHLKDMTP